LQNVISSGSNIGICFQARSSITTGGENFCIGFKAGTNITITNNNIVISSSANVYSDAYSTAILIGTSATNNQALSCPNTTSFNICGLTPSMGTGTGTILEYNLAGNIIPSASTYNSVSKICTAISTIQGQLLAEIIFTTTSTTLLPISWTVPMGVNTITSVHVPQVMNPLLLALQE